MRKDGPMAVQSNLLSGLLNLSLPSNYDAVTSMHVGIQSDPENEQTLEESHDQFTNACLNLIS